jgi:predicted small metal-binding protein
VSKRRVGYETGMRVIECNECGETVTAADDAELARRLDSHLRQEHGIELDDDELEELVAEEAYDAMDS